MNQIFKHYKGGHYRLLHIPDHTETRQKFVVYEQLYDNEYPKGYVWTGPLDRFNEKILYNDTLVPRFKKVDDVLN